MKVGPIDAEKLIRIAERFSLKSLVAVLGLSFIAASTTTMFLGKLFLPEKSVGTARSSGELGNITKQNISIDGSSEKVVLERNIFNSSGELGDAPVKAKPETKKKIISGEVMKSDLPLRLIGVIFAGDPSHGLATIENTQRRHINSFVVGEIVLKDARIEQIFEDRVILKRSKGQEYIEIENKEIVRTRRQRGKRSSSPTDRSFSSIAAGPALSKFAEEGFERDGNKIVMTSQYRENMLTPENMSKLLQDAKAEPNIVGGELRGFKLTRIRENSAYQKAGFQNGDIVLEINGIPLNDVQGAIRLLQQLRAERDIETRVQRGGSSFDLNITVQ